ncbi:hypothetical protein AMTRI_Chr06g195830 [Amborella trichopoda]
MRALLANLNSLLTFQALVLAQQSVVNFGRSQTCFAG